MNKKFLVATSILCAASMLCGCSLLNNETNNPFVNPGDLLGGGGTATYFPEETDETLVAEAKTVIGTIPVGDTSIPQTATQITEEGKISSAGDYYIEGELDGKIEIEVEGVTLYLKDATLSNKKKVIESMKGFTLTLIGNNSVTNTNTDGSNAIDCEGDLTVNGNGNLTVKATKNGISANSIIVKDANLKVTAEKDALHAEIAKFDDATEEPTLSYSDGGYVLLDGANVEIISVNDGIQADSFVYITDSTVNIITNGGAPSNITESSSDNADGKGIKAGAIDWGADKTDLENADYFIYVESGNITLNCNDDAVHSNNALIIDGGTFDITSGDDAIHAENLLQIKAGNIKINNCYEGIEAAKVEIYGGDIKVKSVDDGINAADGTKNQINVGNTNCHIIISGGNIDVNAEGDGVDSNGSILISGGTVTVSGSTGSMNAALDADGSIIINGGKVIAVGALGMVETPVKNSEQYCISFAQNSAISAGTVLTLTDSDGNVLLEYTAAKKCQSVIISSPDLDNGKTYCIYGGNTKLCEFTVSSIITSVGSSNNIGNPSWRPNFGR